MPVRLALRSPEPAHHVTETPQGMSPHGGQRDVRVTTQTARNTNHKVGVGWAPLALQPEFRPKPQDTPTRLLAREASEPRQTEFIPQGQFFCLR